MTTFTLSRQTNSSSRFAQVSVDVVASSAHTVEVSVAVDGYRREAELGAGWALRSYPDGTRVVVTEVVTSETDTSVGDVYEATAHAVWQALQIQHNMPYVAFSDPRMVESWLRTMIGRRLDAVTEARHWYQDRRGPDGDSLLHAWLMFGTAVPVELHGVGDQLLLSKEDPYPSYSMDEYGETRVGPAQPPDVLSRFVGARLTDGAVILAEGASTVCAGLVLRFDDADLVAGSLADEWVLATGSLPAPAALSWHIQPFVRSTDQ